jgi:hypothetical protein
MVPINGEWIMQNGKLGIAAPPLSILHYQLSIQFFTVRHRQIKYAGIPRQTIPSPIRESLGFSVTDPHTIHKCAATKRIGTIG